MAAEHDRGRADPDPAASQQALSEALLDGPDDGAVWDRFHRLHTDEKSALVRNLKERIDRLVRTDPQRALFVADVLMRALGVAPAEDALIRRARGVALYFAGRTQEARTEFLEAARLYERAGSAIEAARMRRNLVEMNLSLGLLEDALNCAHEARRTFEQENRDDLLAELEINVGNVYFRMDEYVLAREHYSAARERFRARNDERGLAFAEFGLANLETAAHRFDLAEEAFLRARAAWLGVGSRAQVADCDYSLAVLDSRRGRVARALDGFQAARSAYADGSKPSGESYVDLDEADLYFRLGAWRDSARLASRAVEGFARIGYEYERSRALALAGMSRMKLGERVSAAHDLEEAASTFRRLGNRTQGAVLDLQSIAAEIEDGEIARSLPRLTSIHAELERSGQRFLHELSTLVLARAYSSLGRAADALHELAPLVAPDRQRTALTGLTQAEAFHALGVAQLALGGTAAAFAAFRQAADETESTYASLPGHDLRLAFFRDRREALCELVWLCAQEAGPDAHRRALGFLERSRMRSLADRRVELSTPSAEFVRLRERMDVLLAARLDAELGSWEKGSQAPRKAPGDSELAQVQDELARRARAESASDRAALEWRPEILADALAPDEIALNYFVGPHGALVLVSERDSVEAVRLEHVERVVALRAKLLFQIEKVRLGDDYVREHGARIGALVDRILDELGGLLLSPVQARIAGRAVVIVPYGELHGLPFHAFRTGGRYLIETSDVSYAPSMTLLARARERAPCEGRRIVAVAEAEESIPGVRREVEELRRLYGSACQTMAPEEFRRRIMELPADVRAIHIASHARFQPEHPLFSGLRLGEGVLSALDLRRMRLRFDLVTLSGCETGRQRRVAGEDLAGLQQALLASGVGGVIGALWPVADQPSADLMSAFYAALATGDPARKALARAVRSQIDIGRPAAFWAPFLLVGDPAARLPAS